jgi:hypothetical protein
MWIGRLWLVSKYHIDIRLERINKTKTISAPSGTLSNSTVKHNVSETASVSLFR